MPQLDILNFYIISSILLVTFWTYFAFLYIAVSYTSQKLAAALYFKFYIILLSIIFLYSLDLKNTDDNSKCPVNGLVK